MRVAGLVTVACCLGVMVASVLYRSVRSKELSLEQRAEDSAKVTRQNYPQRAWPAPIASSDRASSSETRRVFFSTLRPDRAGAVIQDMLLAHAHAFSSKNRTYYGGACPPATSKTTNLTREQVSALVTRLGLGDMLRVACPGEDGHPHDAPIVDSGYYRRNYLRTCTPEWQRFVRSKMLASRGRPIVTLTKATPVADPRPLRAVVHIRRGDVTPCDSLRYLPNSYYLELIRRYVPRHFEVVIYSERNSFETWHDFANYTRILADDEKHNNSDGNDVSGVEDAKGIRDVILAWEAMMNADVLILSKSSFSIVPAILHKSATLPMEKSRAIDSDGAQGSTRLENKPRDLSESVIVYTDFWIHPLPSWTRVPSSVQHEASVQAQKIRVGRC